MQSPLIPNHLAFIDALEQTLTEASATGRPVGLCLLWLDCVDRIDGIFGYHAGDDICSASLDHLAGALRPADRLFRLGRSEIACLLPDANPAQSVLAAHKIVRVLGKSLALNRYTLHSEPSVGVAFFPEHAPEAKSLLQRAISALRTARTHRDRVFVYDSAIDAETQAQLRLQSELRRALDENELSLQHQPQWDLRRKQVSGAEVLTRWHSLKHGPVPPSAFIPTAEAAGFMPRLTSRVLQATLREYAELGAAGESLGISINLSPLDLMEPELPHFLTQSLDTWGIAPQRLVAEVTESAVMHEHHLLTETLQRLRDIGLKIAIDDFGTGFSSLTRLKQLPVDELKIDLSFVRNMLHDEKDEKIVHSVIELGHRLGLRVVAEGVEDAATLARLTALDCDIAQGYYISHPLSLEPFRDWLANPVILP